MQIEQRESVPGIGNTPDKGLSWANYLLAFTLFKSDRKEALPRDRLVNY